MSTDQRGGAALGRCVPPPQHAKQTALLCTELDLAESSLAGCWYFLSAVFSQAFQLKYAFQERFYDYSGSEEKFRCA